MWFAQAGSHRVWALATLALILPTMLGAKCGPTDVEAAGAVLIASPLATIVGGLVIWRLTTLHRRADARVVWNAKPLLGCVICLAVVAFITLGVLSDTDVGRWVFTALFFYGLSNLTLLLIVWRIWLAIAPDTAGVWAWLPVSIVMLAPAMAVVVTGTGGDPIGLLWIYPGWFGIPTSIVGVIFLIEAWVRARSPS